MAEGRACRASCAGAYALGAGGSNECPAGYNRIETVDECKIAGEARGLIVGASITENSAEYPRACYSTTVYVNFNYHAVGAGCGSLENSSDHACTSTSWTSATSAGCGVQASRGSPGRGIVRAAMTVVGVVGTRQMFTYDGT